MLESNPTIDMTEEEIGAALQAIPANRAARLALLKAKSTAVATNVKANKVREVPRDTLLEAQNKAIKYAQDWINYLNNPHGVQEPVNPPYRKIGHDLYQVGIKYSNMFLQNWFDDGSEKLLTYMNCPEEEITIWLEEMKNQLKEACGNDAIAAIQVHNQTKRSKGGRR